ncbi:cyclic pyranopterin monophosphate synthase subunit MoaA [Methanococcoides vulcani]|uniref:Probable GTP 3',8-cyclase n=1 Tax=Methanococcoides vulcani TaxID=1353158 RepID=A0A1H9ZDJ8_9EURY|nr:GTP 3',8-cyclase MoaA [Methanococcoides vulcani]SES79611.1 cyclic pyranopterin monophosphate synthase subunit MoaA [Methanococcoides vulcani]
MKTSNDLLTDKFGRTVRSLRISLTNRCNLDCIYCHSEGDEGSRNEMTVGIISDIVTTAAKFGVNKVKFSGGEPLVRKDFEEILRALPELKDVSVTTNGVLLKDRAYSLKEAGLDRVNVSLDTLDPEKYAYITHGRPENLNDVLEGINTAIDAGLTPVKINMVLLKGINENEIDDMLEFVRGHKGDLVLQIIQVMDFRDGAQYNLDAEEIEKKLERRADEIKMRKMHHRKSYIIDGAEVEFVRPIDNAEFCANCNRLRITADGKLKPCLLVNDNLIDFSNADPEDFPELLRASIERRIPFYTDSKERTIIEKRTIIGDK